MSVFQRFSRMSGVSLHPLILLCGIFFSVHLRADQVATTAAGKKVILKKDGTWRYATKSDMLAVKLMEEEKSGTGKAMPFGAGGERTAAGGSTEKKGRKSLVDILRKSSGHVFRNVSWDMTRAQVKKAETAKIISQAGDTLFYEEAVFGYNSKIFYCFSGNTLTGAGYIIQQPHVDPKLYLADYEELKKHLRPIYGRPLSEDNIWRNSMYKNQPDQWGFAIAIGFLSRRTIWQGENTKIVLRISGQSHRITTQIEYRAINGS